MQYSTNGGSSWNRSPWLAGSASAAVTLPYGTDVLLRETTPPGIAGSTGAPRRGAAGLTTVTVNREFTIGDETTSRSA